MAASAQPHVFHMKLDAPGLHTFYGTAEAAASANYKADSGFDLYVPETVTIPAKTTGRIDLGVIVEPQFTGGYYMCPRSSISKTPLRMANSIGIIDNGYRGHLIAAVDNISEQSYTVERGERLFQLCHPSLQPVTVRVVNNMNLDTERGAGGFGSTSSRATYIA